MQPTRFQTPCRQTFDNDHLLRYVEKRSNSSRDWRLRGGNRKGVQILKVAERLGLLIREVQAFLWVKNDQEVSSNTGTYPNTR